MITTYQIRNVLRVYSNQLRKRNTVFTEGTESGRQPADLVTISSKARRKQTLNQLSSHLISQITPKGEHHEN